MLNKNNLLNYMSLELYNIFKKYELILGGGAIRTLYENEVSTEIEKNEISDFDIYFPSIEHFEKSYENLEKDLLKLGYFNRIKSENAITFTKKDEIPIQLIILKECMLEPNELIKYFDFCVCSAYFDFSKETFGFNDNFKPDIESKILHLNQNLKFPICTLIRIKKYIKKGYSISNLELMYLGLVISKLNINNYEDLKKQLNGIDTLFLEPFTTKFFTPNIMDEVVDFNYFMENIEQYINNSNIVDFEK